MPARLFVALWPTEEVVAALAAAVDPLRDRFPELRWQPPHRWHITLGFLGDRDEQRERARFRRLPLLDADEVSLAGSGRFGPVLWTGVRESGWLTRQAAAVRTAMRVEDRRFRAHLTLARARGATARGDLAGAAAALHTFDSPVWTPPEITLVRSTIGPQPVYEVVARRRLTADGA